MARLYKVLARAVYVAVCVCRSTRAVANILGEWHAKGQATKASTNCVMFCNSHAFCGAPHFTPAIFPPVPTHSLGLKVAGVCLHPLDVAAAPAVLAWMLFSRQLVLSPRGDRTPFLCQLLIAAVAEPKTQTNPNYKPPQSWTTATIIGINSILVAGFKGSHLIKWPHACSWIYAGVSCGQDTDFYALGQISV